jgi:sirohydrochlorin ferrochelatase
VLIAHGSRNPRTAEDHAALCRRIADTAGIPVEPAFLELSEPSIPDAVDAAIAAGATSVRLVPFFLHVGNHVLRDLPELADTAQRRHPDASVVLEEHVGADPALIDLLVARVRG